jgi:amidase
LKIDLKGKRIAWAGDFKGYLPFEPGVLDVCKAALKTFESMGCIVEEAQPNYPVDAVWRAWLQLRAWQAGGALLAFYNDPAKRALMKPEAVFEVESGLKLSAFDVTAASSVRSDWYGHAEILRKIRLFRPSDRATLPVRCQHSLAAGNRWQEDGDVSRGDEGRASDYHVRVSSACRASGF